jgi:AAA15 family ATPase/GTPase
MLPTHYICSRFSYSPQQAAEIFSKVMKTGEKSKCIEIIKLFDSRISDLSVIAENGLSIVYADIGTKTLPMNMLGDGINKLMDIAFTMVASPKSTLLIDEIENGFHYSFFPKLWEIIGKLAIETNCQVIATTHSYECISSAVSLAEDTTSPELFRFVRLDNIKGIVIPKVYENDSLGYALENDWEVR